MAAKYRHALVVDDDPIERELLSAFLRREMCERVSLAGNGAEALEVLRQAGCDVDLIVSDLNMPDVDGSELIQELQAIGCTSPLVIVSAAPQALVSATAVMAKAFGLNVLGFLSKPVRFARLTELLTTGEAGDRS